MPRYGYDKYGHDNRSRERLHIDPEVDLCGDLRLSAVFRPLDDEVSVSLILEAMHYCVKARFDSDGAVTLLGRRRDMLGEDRAERLRSLSRHEPISDFALAATRRCSSPQNARR